MSKLEEIAERLVKELNEKSDVKKIVVNEKGNVDLYGEAEFNVKTQDGTTEKVQLKNYLPARIGKKAFRKLDKNISDGGFSVEDPDSLLDAKDFLINKMMDKSGYQYTADELSMESYNQIGNYYWNKVVEAEKKSKN